LTHVKDQRYYEVLACEKYELVHSFCNVRYVVTMSIVICRQMIMTVVMKMNGIMKVLFVALCIFSTVVVGKEEGERSVALYKGELNPGHNLKFFQSIAGQDIKKLIITSYGGEVEAGIELGRWVFDRGIEVIVSGYCFSSCANYVFTAGSRKVIQPGAVVAWHGNYHHLYQTGLWRDDVSARMKRTNETLKKAEEHVMQEVRRLVNLEKSYFNTINVNQYICWVGKMPPYKTRNYFSMSANDMQFFGVDQVITPKDYLLTNLNTFEDSIEFISISN